jgi:hypothetical protein
VRFLASDFKKPLTTFVGNLYIYCDVSVAPLVQYAFPGWRHLGLDDEEGNGGESEASGSSPQVGSGCVEGRLNRTERIPKTTWLWLTL